MAYHGCLVLRCRMQALPPLVRFYKVTAKAISPQLGGEEMTALELYVLCTFFRKEAKSTIESFDILKLNKEGLGLHFVFRLV
ncbi:hypothetical protein TcasGA2_TC013898 [Tribolium castaneum]|uniref:Uncharacterized protein n=1 Tax=Tribolium castaneum TaxID=7070 RepID=D6WMQ0_TRICA|nr:hypothetical protein TcasGA2_TC013898 [Tribolium castaneum]